jgi:flagellar P-ring protein precursor FlgI
MVTADLSCFAKSGSKVDVTISSIGDASSLEGGTLLLTPLIGPDQGVYAQAQGNISIGGIQIETAGYERYRKNYALVGRIPGGAIVQRDLPPAFARQDTIGLLLRDPDFTTAFRVSQAVDSALGAGSAQPIDAATVSVVVPQAFRTGGLVRLLALVESIEVTPDQTARVVINERTGTVVVGGRVKLSSAAVSQGSLTVKISAMPVISQPAPFSQGVTVAVPQTMTTVSEGEGSKITVLNEPASVNDLADALNTLKVSPRDIISIFQALKQAGALQADLVVM